MCPPEIDLDPPDRVLTPAEVLFIVRRHVPGARALTGIDESGRKGRAHFVDDGIVLKTHRPVRLRGRMVEEFETSLEKEAFFLGEMAGAAGIRVPRPLGYGRECGLEYVCMTRVPGASLRRIDLGPGRRNRALRSLGRTLALIRSLPQAGFRTSALFPIDSGASSLRERLAPLFDEIAAAVNSLRKRDSAATPMKSPRAPSG